ncbi:hypothetical protein F4809DRAFT_635400 [Biscogniauxia mediterranea]|nr:hypothetical protein F4809DRAFT_635400 [Biscogniauxia mediterranea]
MWMMNVGGRYLRPRRLLLLLLLLLSFSHWCRPCRCRCGFCHRCQYRFRLSSIAALGLNRRPHSKKKKTTATTDLSLWHRRHHRPHYPRHGDDDFGGEVGRSCMGDDAPRQRSSGGYSGNLCYFCGAIGHSLHLRTC